MENHPSSPPPRPARAWRNWLLRLPLALAGTAAACGLFNHVAAWQQAHLARRLAADALASQAGGAAAAVRQLARLGIVAIEPMVRLAASQRDDVAHEAQQRILDWLAAWENQYASQQDARLLAKRLATTAAALQQRAAEFGDAGRSWARQVACQLARGCGPLSAGDAWDVLASCDDLLATVAAPARPIAGPAAPAPSSPAEGAPTNELRSARALHSEPGPSGALPTAVDPPAPPPLPPAGIAATASQPPARLAGIDDKPAAALAADNMLRSPEAAPIPETPSEAPAVEAATGQATRLGGAVVDVPSPHDLRNSMRLLRDRSDRELLELVGQGKRFEEAAARRVLQQRGFTPSILDAIERMRTLPAAERRDALENVASLPGSEARRLLRLFVADPDPQIRLQALAMLATTADPQLEQIARERIVEDEDPRVADLATELMKAK